jgi:hypothetical protein
MPTAPEPSASRPRRAWPAWLLLGLLLWPAVLAPPTSVEPADLDVSWGQALGYFLKHRSQAGLDYVWTYGPLGYFTTTAFDPDLFGLKLAWELLVKLLLALLLMALLRALPSPAWRCAGAVVLLAVLPANADLVYLLGILCLVLLPLGGRPWPAGLLAAGTAFLAALALTKFTFLLLATAAWLLLTAGSWPDVRRAGAILASFPAALLGMWWLLGQEPGNLPAFLRGALEITWGYAGAMATPGSGVRPALGLAAVALLAALVATYPRPALRRHLPGLALLALGVFLQWKHGFVRQASHEGQFFTFLACTPFALAALLGPAPHRAKLRATLAALIVLTALPSAGLARLPRHWLDGATFALAPGAVKQECLARRKTLAQEWALPRLSRVVGDDPVDQLSCAQGVVFLNGWRYRPRPVFQSYSAYTPELLRRNAEFYSSPGAPPYVLWRWDPIDGRLPTLEDGPALLELFRRYRLAGQERGFLLLERSPAPPTPAEGPVLCARTAGFGEEVDLAGLPGGAQVLRLDITPSPWGRLVGFLYRPPPLYLRVRTEGGQVERYRLVPAMAGAGLLINPLLRTDKDVAAFYTGGPLPRVRSFSVEAGASARRCYGERIGVSVRGAGL